MNSRYSPVIVIGMHRSGTTLITRMLEDLGLFVGATREGNEEATFFRTINEWLMSQSGAAWDHPDPINYLLRNKDIRPLTQDYIVRYLMESPRVISFLGWRKYLRYGTPFELDCPWGWKNPLNTYTLPLWLDIFPTAKVIHVYRHGVDVANSLMERTLHGMQRTSTQRLYYKLRSLHWIRPKVAGFIPSMRCASLDGGLSLWEEYLSQARYYTHKMPGRALEIKYEDLLSDPYPAVKTLAQFCALSAKEICLHNAARQVNKERAYAYRQNRELKSFADGVADRLVAHNYSA